MTGAPAAPKPAGRDAIPPRRRLAGLPLTEPPPVRRPPRARPDLPANPHAEWAIALHRTEILPAALRRSLPLALRLARRLARGQPPTLRESAVPWHVLHDLSLALDCLLTRLDGLARPDAWSGIDPDPGPDAG
ncbi:MAG: hypothetical protein FP825_14185 [Hyphomonas sp.]|uniref:hypothetical protein n=1 Tax=Hyphomonas sp. TaxID=87 RepID=UPI0017AC76FF|nr:hypothetical protein [Hyphomonas sp.]MBA3069616.1 hypothetical protein [Hyphomonas sp.]MBU3921291.1 hypothetical protein [Alphaproteobacteria bacterium]MBU4063223.1 hypothetical protein [Alphaproteobacteria bacterium]MBU4164041.1 hypothetical protein [Alphaproteobacteria bacterium]